MDEEYPYLDYQGMDLFFPVDRSYEKYFKISRNISFVQWLECELCRFPVMNNSVWLGN